MERWWPVIQHFLALAAAFYGGYQIGKVDGRLREYRRAQRYWMEISLDSIKSILGKMSKPARDEFFLRSEELAVEAGTELAVMKAKELGKDLQFNQLFRSEA